MRVLLLSDLCNPLTPSLPVVGYNYAKAIAEKVDAVVVTQVRNRPNLEKSGVGRAEVLFVDTEPVAAPLYRLARRLRGGDDVAWTVQMAIDYPSYLAFEGAAYLRVREGLARGEFDVVHRITPMSPTLPSPMARLSPVPFVLGPLNGNLRWPRAFTQEMRREREILSHFRSAHKVLPFHGSSYSRSAAILAAFEHTIADIPSASRDRTINFPEVGIDPALFHAPERSPRERMTVLFAGRLVPYKLPEVVLRAVAGSDLLRKHRTVVVGDGPELPRLQDIIRAQRLGDCVELKGRLSQREVGSLMRESEIFAFPSIRELGAGVVVEAMACGMTCVVTDYGGPGTLIADDRGVKVALQPLESLVGAFRASLEELVRNPDRVRRLGAAAHAHAMKFYTWEAKAEKTVEIYEWVLAGRRSTKPDFWAQQTSSPTQEPVPAAPAGV